MPKTNRKRKPNSNANNRTNKKNKDLDNLCIESEKENLAEINNNITIVRLPESILDGSEDDNDDDDCEWENVSELEDKSDIIVNLYDEDFKEINEVDIEKRFQQKLERELRENLHRTMLMALIGRSMYINRIINNKENLIAHLAMSCLPGNIHKYRNWNESKCRKIFDDLFKQFEIKQLNDESGNIERILINSFEKKSVPTTWINVLFVAVLRQAGIKTRLVSALYPIPLKKSSNKSQETEEILCPPTVHKPSTRGGRLKNSKKPKTVINVSIKTCQNPLILFTLEIFDEQCQKWIPIDVRNADSWNDLSLVIKEHPRFLYCLAIDNDGLIKDLAGKYDRNWPTSSRRQRLSESSFCRIIQPFQASIETEDDRIENAEIRTRIIDQGVPSTLSDLKGHPMFVLKSHLLKYEIVYPADVEPFGWWRNEEVYLRDNVYLAHTKETWLKEAKVIRTGELPCKKVKTLMSRRKEKEMGSDPFVELFGPWQVKDYVPPVAVDGVVPRNVYGNVDLFKPSMLPIGCTHLFLKDLDKVSNQLGIDCVPAMIGWAFTKRNKARPIYEGWIVCNEHVKVAKAAWSEANAIQQAKLADRRRIIIIKRWQILTRRLLLKERLRLEYNF